MIRTFIQTKEFIKNWASLGFTDDDLRRLEGALLENPRIGKVVSETGGLRKMRFAFEDRGKSGSVRVCYVDFEIHDTIYLITAYAKNEQENLTRAQKREIKKVIECLETELIKRR